MSDEKKDFEVKDRRIFSEENREDETQDKAQSTKSSPEAEAQTPSSTEESQATEDQERPSAADAPMPEINFATFVVSLNASALLHLGAIEDPNTGQATKDLTMAKQTIDILNLLEEKTEGNLSDEENNLIKSILYDLRIIYVKESG